ncbi:MAG: PAS domain-containing protein [Chloroflexota bacterium]
MERITVGQVPAIAEVARLLPVAVIATDIAGRVIAWTPHAETLYGWAESDVLGRDIRDLTVGPSEAHIAEAILARLVAGETWQGEFTAARADGGARGRRRGPGPRRAGTGRAHGRP